jgi:hypothetical protein
MTIAGALARGPSWRVAARATGVLLAGLGAWLLPVPAALGPSSGASAFAAVTSAALVAISTIPVLVAAVRTERRMAAITALVALGSGIAAYAAGGYAARACTAGYGESRVVIGTEWTPLGDRYHTDNPQLSNEELLFDAAGAADRIWTSQSIDRCRMLVSGTYFLWFPCLIACLTAVIQLTPSRRLSALARGVPAGSLHVANGKTAPTEPRYDVFVSYRHGGIDTTVARELAAQLEEVGYIVAIDERDFPANASFLAEMERAIHESRYTVAIVSPRYLDSGNCEEEAVICKVLDMGDRRRRLIPLVIEPVEMPVWLYGIVGIDATKQDALVEPFDKLTATIGPPLSQAAGVSP